EIALLEVRNLIKSQSLLKDEARELFSKKQLDFVSPFLSRLKLSPEETKLIEESRAEVVRVEKEAVRKKRVIQISISIFIFILLILLGFSWIQMINAEKATGNAEKATEKAEKATEKAEKAKKEAIYSLNEAIFKDINKLRLDLEIYRKINYDNGIKKKTDAMNKKIGDLEPISIDTIKMDDLISKLGADSLFEAAIDTLDAKLKNESIN
ncbi:MAG: Unknown protein, partial [uncultured Sulfurovum sp.]